MVLQPSYLPWLGYFDQYQWADVFVLYDDVQYDRNGWRNRNRILAPYGVQWLTVPVCLKGMGFPLIREVKINGQVKWGQKHLRSLKQAYAKCPFFDEIYPPLEAVIQRRWDSLLELNVEVFRVLVELLGMRWKVVFSSELGVEGRKTKRLVEICRLLGATDYLTGDAARNYLNEEEFEKEGIKVHWHSYEHPVYPQYQCKKKEMEFVPFMSVVDLLFNCGDKSLSVLARTSRSTSGDSSGLQGRTPLVKKGALG